MTFFWTEEKNAVHPEYDIHTINSEIYIYYLNDNYQRNIKSNFTVEKPGKHHLDHLIKVTIPVTGHGEPMMS